MALRKKIETNEYVLNLDVPPGKRVTNVSVTEFEGRESVNVLLEDQPSLPPSVLATVIVER